MLAEMKMEPQREQRESHPYEREREPLDPQMTAAELRKLEARVKWHP